MIEKIFSCTRCGFCCHGETTVSLDDNDQVAMQLALDIPMAEMLDRFLRTTGTVVQMKIKDGHCIYYQNNGCSVHEGRPWRCRQWPLHPAILADEANFQTIAESCPGINRNLSYTEFSSILREILDSQKP